MTLYDKVNQLLCEFTITQRNIHIIHWNLKSEIFILLHDYLGQVYTTLVEYIDNTVEKIRFQGSYPMAKLRECYKNAQIKSIESNRIYSYKRCVDTIISNITYLKKLTNDIIIWSDINKQWDGVDKFKEHLLCYSKALYLLKNSEE